MALILFSALLAGCASGTPAPTATPTPLPFMTATLIPTFTPRPSQTLAPPTLGPTAAPVTGIVTTQINVRSAPDKNATALGLLNATDRVLAVGRDSSEKWLMIVYPPQSSTTGWVSVEFLQVEGDLAQLPVMQAGAPLPEGGTPLPPPTATSDIRQAKVTQTINVRAGPATIYDAVGTVSAGTMVILTGRNEINNWIQIEFPEGPEGRGWVAALYVENPNLQGLPYYDNQGKLLSSPTQGVNPGQPTATPTTFGPAGGDGDSEENPAVRLAFSPDGSKAFTYSSDLSSPTGDDADWVAFTPYMPTSEAGFVYAELDCAGNGGVTATLEKDGLPVPGVPQLVCGNYDLAFKVLGGQEYTLVLRADGSGGPLRFVSYTLTISAVP